MICDSQFFRDSRSGMPDPICPIRSARSDLVMPVNPVIHSPVATNANLLPYTGAPVITIAIAPFINHSPHLNDKPANCNQTIDLIKLRWNP